MGLVASAVNTHPRKSGDLAMPQARMLGIRRHRPFTPSSVRPAKVAEKKTCDDTARALYYQDQPSQDMLVEMAQGCASQEIASAAADYDMWDLVRYKGAKTMQARGQFWLLASEESRSKIAAELLKDPPSTPAMVQAKQMNWIQ